jgi:DNA recombination protein RmuC
MFLPAESVYYALISDDNLCIRGGANQEHKPVWSYALEKHVIPVSPNTLYAYLTVIVYGLRGLQIEQKTKEILDYLLQLQVEFGKLQREWATLGTHLTNAKAKYEGLDRPMLEFGDRLSVETITGLGDSLPAGITEDPSQSSQSRG